jgi:hypothetical protein
MNHVVILILHETLCAAIFFSVFCRSVKSSAKVRADVRLAFVMLGTVACAGMAAPLVWGLIPDLFVLSLLASIAAVQIATSRHWADGVPQGYYRPEFVPRLRRATDYLETDRRDFHDHANITR